MLDERGPERGDEAAEEPAGGCAVGLLSPALDEEGQRQQAEHPGQRAARCADVEVDADADQQQPHPWRPRAELVDAEVGQLGRRWPERTRGGEHAEGEQQQLDGAEDQPRAAGDHRARGQLGHAGDDQRAGQQHGDRGQQGAQRAVKPARLGGTEDQAADREGGDDREQRRQQL